MKNMKKMMALMLALALLVGGVIGGTIAWLIDTTDEVTNTFTTSDIDIELDENTQKTNNYQFKMIPGHTNDKDPFVTVKKGSEACWLFVKVSEAGGVVEYTQGTDTKTTTWDDFLTYAIDTGVTGKAWTELTDAGKLNPGEKVYYIEVADLTAANAEDVVYHILKDDQVKVKDTVTKEMMNALDADTTEYPTLTFKAYAIQKANTNATGATTWSAAEAWKKTPDYVAPTP